MSVTVCPVVITVEPLAEMTGTGGGVHPFAEIATGTEEAVQPLLAEMVTV